jgi:hypothetical protein
MFRAEHSAGSRQWQSAAVGSPLANGFFQPSAIGIRLSATVHIPSLCNLRPVGGWGALLHSCRKQSLSCEHVNCDFPADLTVGGVSHTIWRNFRFLCRIFLLYLLLHLRRGSATWLAEPPLWRGLVAVS